MKKKILIVDDETQIVRLLKMRLEANNYEIVTAFDGNQCTQVANSEIPDMILLDIKMPMGGGITAFNTLRNNEKTKNIPVIFLTAYPSESVKNQVFEMGAEGFIAKPFNSTELIIKIQTIIGI